jgi:hypothetical protein
MRRAMKLCKRGRIVYTPGLQREALFCAQHGDFVRQDVA